MSSISPAEQTCFESLLSLQSGYVIDSSYFSDASFGSLFSSKNIDIHSKKYQRYGTSKAKKLRGFWEIENDKLVGEVLSDILDVVEAKSLSFGLELNKGLLEKCREICQRLRGKSKSPERNRVDDLSAFLRREFAIKDLDALPIESGLVPIVKGRIDEAVRAHQAGAYLSVIFLCGSVLEGVLLGAAINRPRDFNQAHNSPKANDGSVKKFHEWSLRELIDVSFTVGVLKEDVRKFSHSLRDFRNYIHPNQQLVSGFSPDEHTSKICMQVLKAALASVSGSRKS